MFESDDSFSHGKHGYRIVIFGSYEQMSRIKKLKDRLRRAGYSKTDYVEELPNPAGIDDGDSDQEFALKKSKFYLGWSDVNIFVLFKGSDQGSVAMEIGYLFYKISERIECANFLVEKGTNLATLIEGAIKDNECNIEPHFDNDDELFDLVKSNCWIHLTEDNCHKTRIH